MRQYNKAHRRLSAYPSMWICHRLLLFSSFKTPPITSCSSSCIPDPSESPLDPGEKAEKLGVPSWLLPIPCAPWLIHHQVLSLLVQSSLSNSLPCSSFPYEVHILSFTNTSPIWSLHFIQRYIFHLILLLKGFPLSSRKK